jgi:hypothetical protein
MKATNQACGPKRSGWRVIAELYRPVLVIKNSVVLICLFNGLVTDCLSFLPVS